MPASHPHNPPVLSSAPALPVPSPGRVCGFQSLYQRKFGVCLDSDEAARLLTLLMHVTLLADQNSQLNSQTRQTD